MLLLIKGNAIPWPSTELGKWQLELSDGINIYQSLCIIKKGMQQLSFQHLSSQKLIPLLTVVTDFSDAKSLLDDYRKVP